MTDTLLYAGAGLLVGTMVGLTGVGGGSMMTPILMLLFGQSPSVAVGTDLLFSATTKLAATASFGFSRRVDWPIVGRLLLGSVPGSAAVVIGLWLARHTPSAADAITSRSIAIILLVTAVALIFQMQLQRVGLKITARALVHVERHKILLTALAGLTLGVAVTLTSVGAGALGVTALIFLYPRLPLARIVGSDIAHAVPLTAIAGLGHWWLGDVNGGLLVSLLVGSLPGIFLGSFAAALVPEKVVRYILAAVLLLVGGKLVF